MPLMILAGGGEPPVWISTIAYILEHGEAKVLITDRDHSSVFPAKELDGSLR